MPSPNIGFATLSIIPSLRGVESEINRQLGSKLTGAGARAGSQFGQGFASGAGKQIATGFTVGVAGAAALTAATLKTGLAYNVLESRARTAFDTLLGGKDAAAAMIDQLKEFSKSSPFPRQAFIEGAQQLVAFGLEAEKVVPTLDAIQDATAASGGNAQRLSEIVFVMGQISAAGKITGRDLIQFGDRGIDAASLIGSQMGKTGAQIREDITAGAIDADTAIAALTDGMKQRFDGAAAGVKSTFIGATDRVKGAVRDIGSALVEPFVSKQGGGAAVDWANTLADSLRVIEAEVIPAIVPGIESIARSMGKAADAAAGLVTPGSLLGLLDTLKEIAPVVSGASASLVALGSRSLPVIGSLLPAINPVVAGITALALASPEARDALAGVASEVAPLVAELGESLVPILANLSTIAGTVLPPAINLAGSALVGVLGVVSSLAPLVESLTGFLADNETVVLALASAYIGLRAAAVLGAGFAAITSGAAAASSAVQALAVSLRTAGAVEGFSGVAKTLSNTTVAAGGVAASLGTVAGAIGIATIAWKKYDDARKAATTDESVLEIANAISNLDLSDGPKAAEDITAAAHAVEDLSGAYKNLQLSGWERFRLEGPGSITGGTVEGDIATIDRYDKALAHLVAVGQEAQAAEFIKDLPPGLAAKMDNYRDALAGVKVAEDGAKESAEKLTGAIEETATSAEKVLEPILAMLSTQSGLVQAQRTVTDSFRELTEAQETAAGRGQEIADLQSAAAEQRASDARAVADAEQQGAQQIADAQDKVTDSIEAVNDAKIDQVTATADLIQARKDEAAAWIGVAEAIDEARERLKLVRDEQLPLKDADVADAKDALLVAQQRLDEQRLEGDDYETPFDDVAALEREVLRRQIALAQAQREAAATRQELTDAEGDGIRSTDEVAGALDTLQTAQDNTATAEQKRLDSIAAVALAVDGQKLAELELASTTEEANQRVNDANATMATNAQLATDGIKEAIDQAKLKIPELTTVAETAASDFATKWAAAGAPITAITLGLQNAGLAVKPGTDLDNYLNKLIFLAQLGDIGIPGTGGQRGSGQFVQNRTGGLYSFAGGGVTPAHVGRGTLYKWAEPETGGEAFIPRLGNRQRSEAILRQAASWYGLDLIEKERRKRMPPMMSFAFGGIVGDTTTTSGGRRGRGAAVVFTGPVTINTKGPTVREVRDEIGNEALARLTF